jgi:hypothetical protein
VGLSGFRLLGRLGQKGTCQTQEEYDRFYLFKLFSKRLELNQLKDKLPILQKNQIKYVFEAFEIRNNVPYWNLSKCRIDFELKFKKKI